MTNSLEFLILVCSAITSVVTIIGMVAAMTGKVFTIKTKTQITLENHETRLHTLECFHRECRSDNKRHHALMLKAIMGIVTGMKKGQINGEIDSIKEEVDTLIFEQLGESKGH